MRFLISGLGVFIIVISSLAALLVAYIFLYIFLIRHIKLEKKFKTLKSKYQYLHNLLINEDMKHLKRIEFISEVNLLYVEIYQKYEDRYKSLDREDKIIVQPKISNMDDYLKNKNRKMFKFKFNDFKQTLSKFEEGINTFNNDLLQIIRPEEECNHQLSLVLESLKLLKQDFKTHENELIIVEKSFNDSFAYVESLIEKYKGFVEVADYLEATNLLPSIVKIVDEIKYANKTLPYLCVYATKTITSMLDDLEINYKHMQQEEIPVTHIINSKTIPNIRKSIDEITNSLKDFIYKDAEAKLDEIKNNIDLINKSFEKEREDCVTFKSKVKSTYDRLSKIERDFIKLCNALPKIKKVYILSKKNLDKKVMIQTMINKISISKRSLDNFIHSESRQPYSILLIKTNELIKEAESIEKEMEEFRLYLTSLKTDVENAHEYMFEFYYRIKSAEKLIRDASIQNFSLKYKESVKNLYNILEKINYLTLNLPINVEDVNNKLTYLKNDGDALLNAIEQETNLIRLTESGLIYLNTYRREFDEIEHLVSDNEKVFLDGNINKAYNQINVILERYNELKGMKAASK